MRGAIVADPMLRLAHSARASAPVLAAFGLFLALLLAEGLAGHAAYNRDLSQHRQAAIGYWQFLSSGHFIEATAENWESEFLGLALYVLLAARVPAGSARRVQGAALLLLFLASFLLHAIGGLRDYNLSQLQNGAARVSLTHFMSSATFWFQSLQNWQSAFLGLALMRMLGVLSGELGRLRGDDQRGRAVQANAAGQCHSRRPTRVVRPTLRQAACSDRK